MSDIYSWLETSSSEKGKADSAGQTGAPASNEKPTDSALEVLSELDAAYLAGAKKADGKKNVFHLPDGNYIFDIIRASWEKREPGSNNSPAAPTIALKWIYRVVAPETFEGKQHEQVMIISEKNVSFVYRDFKTLYAPGASLLEYFDALPFLSGTRVSATLKTNEKNHYQVTYLNRVITLGDDMKKFLEDYTQGSSPTHTNPI